MSRQIILRVEIDNDHLIWKLAQPSSGSPHPQGFSWEKMSFLRTDTERDTGLASAEELCSCMLDRNIWTKITEQARAFLHGARHDDDGDDDK